MIIRMMMLIIIIIIVITTIAGSYSAFWYGIITQSTFQFVITSDD